MENSNFVQEFVLLKVDSTTIIFNNNLKVCQKEQCVERIWIEGLNDQQAYMQEEASFFNIVATNQEEPERRTNMQHQEELENLGVCASQAKENTLMNYMSISQEEEEERIEIRNLYWNIYRAVHNEESIKIAREPNV